ncbi:LysR family transcriptional regulator [Ferrimonas aestuarii]|uniref:LysR family transcriptional regulator n=1 Tax=Ferrimonas aestuarii TaxID=2569539 RepID=A0A4U1BLC4_9GAMM|nr:LysR family transcriptional regulator [Ferrimonas aestuarii]TKB53328.1 LysR family transcriptional regulator [Ferrimonas aestuarii]
MLSFEQLKSMVVFAHVVNRGNFSSAARHLGLTRGVVSYHINKLEQQLGVTLLNRSTRTLSLTEAGRNYYQYCQAITDQAATAQQQIENFKQEPSGELKISVPVNLGLQILVPAFSQFKTLFPKIKLQVALTDEVVDIVAEGVDLAIRGAPLVDSSLQATRLADLQTGLFAAPSYLNRFGRPDEPEQLNQHQWVHYLGSDVVELFQGNRSYSIKTQSEVATNNASARTAFVVGGHGIGRIPRYDAQPKVEAGLLEPLLSAYELKPIEVYAVFAQGAATTKKLRVLLDFLKQHFEQLADSLNGASRVR